jgi:DNA-binding NarL/FixJ family response regulator
MTNAEALSFLGRAFAPGRGPLPAFTPRERQIVDSVRSGQTHKEIAYDLGISDATVRVLYARAMRKLGREPRPSSRGGGRPPGG